MHFKINMMKQSSVSPPHTSVACCPTSLLAPKAPHPDAWHHHSPGCSRQRTLAFPLTLVLSLHETLCLGAAINPVSATFQIDSKYSNSPPSPSPLPRSGLCFLDKSSSHRPLVSPLSFLSPSVYFLEYSWSDPKKI